MSLEVYFICFLLGVILILIIVIIILSFVIKRLKRKEKIAFNQKIMKNKEERKKIKQRGKEYEKHIEKAKTIDDYIDIFDNISRDIMQNNDNNY